MQIGNRVVYDQDGQIIHRTGEMQGDVLPRKEITELHFVDLPYGAINIYTHRLVGINPETREPILEELPQYISPEQQRINELEDALLLAADAEVGGIL